MIDAANLQAGGAIQVAASFLDELARMRATRDVLSQHPWLYDGVTVEASDAVLENMTYSPISLPITRVNRRGFDPRDGFRRERSLYDVAFVVFGPRYARRRAHREISGFADVTSLWPELARRKHAALPARLRAKGRRSMSRAVFRASDHIVVETEHVREALAGRWGIPHHKISVVSNTWNAVFDRPVSSVAASAFRSRIPSRGLNLLYVARAYPHKNHRFIGEFIQHAALLGAVVNVVVTLNGNEWRQLDELTRSLAFNIGPVSVEELPGLYAAVDGVLFPSLLEAFSATPLEALVASKPLFASDRGFVKDIAGGAATYFDPLDPRAAAKGVVAAYDDETGLERKVAEGQKVVRSWPSSRDRAARYVSLISRHLERVVL